MKLNEIISQPYRIFNSVEEANIEADKLNADPEDDWEYRVVPDPKGSGRALIKIYDEDGEFVENL